MESLHALAARLDQASATLTAVARAVTATDPAQAAFGADGPGRPGAIGRALHRQWIAATDTRAREASAAAARLAAAASALRDAAARYADVDETAHHRLTAAPADSWFGGPVGPAGSWPAATAPRGGGEPSAVQLDQARPGQDAARGGFWPGPEAIHRSLGGGG